MKTKILLLLFVFSNAITVKATVHEIPVANFHFAPASLEAIVGDTIRWVWDAGTHTTTGTSVNIPEGADTWDAPIDASNQSFEYVIEVEGRYFYFSKVDGDMSGSFTASGTLPVQLINFKVAAVFNKVLLSWNTVSEQNTAYFSIQRSIDAKRFIEIAQVRSAGTSSAIKQYSYTDNNADTKQYFYYKIITVDADGSQTQSPVVMFKKQFQCCKTRYVDRSKPGKQSL
jgi:plastocyanin